MTGSIRRREFLAAAAAAGGALGFSPRLLRQALAATAVPEGPYGPLQPPNADGLMLPPGFTSRQIARGGKPVGGYVWHFASDGQAAFRTKDGGYVLVSNSEAPAPLGGGSSAIRFTPDGEIDRAYRILVSNMNCAGGPTPWGTWLSCEEHPGGMVWEADPAGVLPAMPRPALGNFAHEAAAVDPVHQHVYLTEDEGDGCFYRFTPDDYPSLVSGVLEAAIVAADGTVTWQEVPDPNLFLPTPLRNQVPGATRFDGGEGIWYDEGVIYFTTKGDRKVWAYDTVSSTLEKIYDRADTPGSALDAVDNVTVSAAGDIYVCEDGGNMEIGIITPEREVSPFLRLIGPHEGSEMAGVVFDPSGTRMYFASQRAYPYAAGTPAADGAIYEVTGPFRLPDGGVPASKVFGPPAGEGGLVPLPPAHTVPGLVVRTARKVARRILRQNGLPVRLRLDRPATVELVLRTADAESAQHTRWVEPRPVLTRLGRRRVRLRAGSHVLRVPVDTHRLPRGRSARAVLTVVATTQAGRRLVAAQELRVVNR